MNVNGFSFIEFTADNIDEFNSLFYGLGFTEITNSSSNNKIKVFEQGKIQFVVNCLGKFEKEFSEKHGPSISGFGFIVDDPNDAHTKVIADGAVDISSRLDYLAIEGIGGSRLYLTDDLMPTDKRTNVGLSYIDHLTHNVFQGNMDTWADFYSNHFNFYQLHFFDIKGEQTSLVSRAMGNGKIAIPLNESEDEKSQINEYLRDYNGEGVQHVALHTNDIYKTIEIMKGRGIKFLDVPDTYYEMLEDRIPGHGENLELLRKYKILIDGEPDNLLLQIFTKTCIGPIFFEIIQRKKNEGFGEGNFKALFDSIERDQKRRGVL